MNDRIPHEKSGEPYCNECGYVLSGLTDSARCPECGRPIVDVLVRRTARPAQGRRYRSKAMIFGLPAIDIALGPHEDELRGRARGFVAIGDSADGVVAIGGRARGVFAFGGLAIGGVAVGGCSVGLVGSLGGAALGAMAMGGAAAGALARGGGAAGWIADGGGAVGMYARGGGVLGTHTIGPAGGSQAAVDMFDRFAWFFGAWPPTPLGMWISLLTFVAAAAVAAGLLALIAWVLDRRAALQSNS